MSHTHILLIIVNSKSLYPNRSHPKNNSGQHNKGEHFSFGNMSLADDDADKRVEEWKKEIDSELTLINNGNKVWKWLINHQILKILTQGIFFKLCKKLYILIELKLELQLYMY